MSESDEKVLWDLNRRRMWCIDKLRIYLEKAQKIAAEDLRKLEHKGPSGYYSMNHDILDVAFRIWRASQELGVLKSMEKDIEEAFEELKAPAGGGAHVRETYVDPFELPPPAKEVIVPQPEEADVVPEKEDDDKE